MKSKGRSVRNNNNNKLPRQILYDHFHAHQLQHQNESGKPTTTRKSEISLTARVRQIQEELDTLSLTTAMGKVSLNNPTKSKSSSTSDGIDRNHYEQQQQHQEIADSIVGFCQAAMLTEVPSPAVEAVLELATALSARLGSCDGSNTISKDHNDPSMLVTVLLPHVFDFLRNPAVERVRALACHWLGYCVREVKKNLVHQNQKNESLPMIEDALSEIESILLGRLHDKAQSVRQAAIRACGNFFNKQQHDWDDEKNIFSNSVEDSHERIMQALLWSCSHDPSFANRMQAMASLPWHQQAVGQWITGIRDEHAKVRVQALESLRQMPRNMIMLLTPQQCADVVHAGLTDRCTATYEATSKLICTGWMKAFKYNPLTLVRNIGVSANEKACDKALRVVFDAADNAAKTPNLVGVSQSERQAFASGVSNAIVPIQGGTRLDDQATPEKSWTPLDANAVFFSRVACQRAFESETMASVRKANFIAHVVPDITVLCQVLQSHLDGLVEAHSAETDGSEIEDNITIVCSELLQLAKMCDLQEEGSRRHFLAAIKQILSSPETPEDLIEGCINRCKDACEHEADFMQNISSILDALAHSFQSGGDKNNANDEDVERVLRILLILSVVLETTVSTKDLVAMGFEKYIMPAVTHPNVSVREAGVSCFGKLGLFTDQESRLAEFKPLMLRVASRLEETLEVRAQALMALSDWALLFPDILTPCNIDGDATSLMGLVSDLLYRGPFGGVAVAAEVATRLLFSAKVRDSEIIAQLVILFFDEPPTSKRRSGGGGCDDGDIELVGSPERLQQLLSLFFPAYANQSSTGREVMLGSIGPLLCNIHGRPTTKSNRSIVIKPTTVINMINYICSNVDMALTNSSVTTERKKQSSPDGQRKETFESPVNVSTPCSISRIYLSACIQMGQFLVKAGEDIGTMMLRSLCKLMATMSSSVGGIESCEDRHGLAVLKNCTEELGMVITDPASLQFMATLNEALADVVARGVDDDETLTDDTAGNQSQDDDDEESLDHDEGSVDASIAKDDDKVRASSSCDDASDEESVDTVVNGMKSISISGPTDKENSTCSTNHRVSFTKSHESRRVLRSRKG